MDYKLKTTAEGDVEVIMKSGNDYVRTLKTEGEMLGVIKTAKKVEMSADYEGFISVNDGEILVAGAPVKGGKAEKVADAESEPKSEKPTSKASTKTSKK